MKARDVMRHAGVPEGPAVPRALRVAQMGLAAGLSRADALARVAEVVRDPHQFLDDPERGELARLLAEDGERRADRFVERVEPAPWRQWGEDLEPQAVNQLRNACRLPVAVRGALMPDAHVGYGLPIGGVLATENAVIPYAVGVDIACRMRLTVTDLPARVLQGETERLGNAIEDRTRFGMGAHFDRPHDHRVMEADWKVSPVTARVREKAWRQLGTSGSGNHFVEFGWLTLDRPDLGLEAGRYVALLSHSGSRGPGATVAGHYSRLAMERHPELPRELKHLAWLSLDEDAGREYWAAMELMGRFAQANHEVIHREVLKALGAKALAMVENHHNFAWKESHDGREVVVHRKGATPAQPGVLGVIPGSMATPGYVVRGRAGEASLGSASHGAGRVMSRTRARETFRWPEVRKLLAERGVTLLSADLDENPGVYKDIGEVMAAQTDLVDTVARFDPVVVKMAPPGEKPED